MTVSTSREPAKIAGMVLAASIMARFGLTMFYFRVPFNLGHLDVVVADGEQQSGQGHDTRLEAPNLER